MPNRHSCSWLFSLDTDETTAQIQLTFLYEEFQNQVGIAAADYLTLATGETSVKDSAHLTV